MEDRIFVSREEFKTAIQNLKETGIGQFPKGLIIFCAGERLVISTSSLSYDLKGCGSFTGRAVLSENALKPMIMALPEEDPLPIIRYSDGLGVGNLRFRCQWKPHLSFLNNSTTNDVDIVK